MGKGEGLGEGIGRGAGEGAGEGVGEGETGAIVGGSLAICCMVCFIIIGLPMFIAGIVLVAMFIDSSAMMITGVVFIIVSLIMVIGVVGFGIYSCMQANKRRQNQPNPSGAVLMTTQQGAQPVVIHQSVAGPQQPQPAGQYNAYYQQGQPPAYQPPPQGPVPVYNPPPQGNYPPAGQPGIYPTQQLPDEKY